MVELAQVDKQEVQSVNIYLWAFNVRRYDLLRKIDGCSGLTDLHAVTLDQQFVRQIANVLKIPEGNCFIDSDVTLALTK